MERLVNIIETIESEITKLRSNIRYAGDDADKVYIGEAIGKLEVAAKIILNYIENNS